jgi:hypothetical protein
MKRFSTPGRTLWVRRRPPSLHPACKTRSTGERAVNPPHLMAPRLAGPLAQALGQPASVAAVSHGAPATNGLDDQRRVTPARNRD